LLLEVLVLLRLVLLDKVVWRSLVEENRNYLKVGFSVDDQEVFHDVFLCDAAYDLVHVFFPLRPLDVALRELFAIQEKSDDPQDLVP
jgi:hypothetical protein